MQPVVHADHQHRRKRQRRAAPTMAPGMNMMNPLAQMMNPMMNPMMAMMMNQQPAHHVEEESQSDDDQPLQQIVAKAQGAPPAAVPPADEAADPLHQARQQALLGLQQARAALYQQTQNGPVRGDEQRIPRSIATLKAVPKASVRSRPALDDVYIDALAATQGFQDVWFDSPNPRAKAKAKAGAAPVQPQPQGASGLPAGQQLLSFAPTVQPGASQGVGVMAARPKPSPVMPPPTVAPAPTATAGRVSAPPTVSAPPEVPVAAAAEVAAVEVGVAVIPEDSTTLHQTPVEPQPEPPASMAPSAVAVNSSPPLSPVAVGLSVPADMRDEIAGDDQRNGSVTVEGPQTVGAGHEEDERKECCICRQPMDPHSTVPEETLMAIRCGHVFHKSCILRTWSVGGWPDQWCPLKCHDSLDETMVRDMEMELERQMMDDSDGGAVAVETPQFVSQGAGEMVL
eukprot:s464_g41.t1